MSACESLYNNPLTEVGSVNQSIGNIAVNSKGRIFVSSHPFFRAPLRLMEVTQDKILPYPSTSWNCAENERMSLDNVLGIRMSSNDTLWILDAAGRLSNQPKLIEWDTNKEELKQIIPICQSAIRAQSFLNDFVIDEAHQVIFISDEGDQHGANGEYGAIIAVDLQSGESRRLFEGHPCVQPEDVTIQINGKMLRKDHKNGDYRPMRVGVDGIAIDHESEWVYFAPLTSHSLYRVRTKDLANKSLSSSILAKKIERFCTKPISGGMIMDNHDTLFLTAMTENEIGYVGKDKTYHTLIKDSRLVWPDGFALGPDGDIFVTTSQLHLHEKFNDQDRTNKTFKIYKFSPEAGGITPLSTGINEAAL